METTRLKLSKEVLQTVWETWFVASVAVCITLMIVMILDNSREVAALPYILVASMFNLLVCAYRGCINKH